jgi:hypothetical protein
VNAVPAPVVIGVYPTPGGCTEADPSTDPVAVLREFAVTVFEGSVIVLKVRMSVVSLPTKVVF